MSVEPREPMGMAHMTVVPTNFGRVDDVESDDEDDERMDVPSDPRVPRHR